MAIENPQLRDYAFLQDMFEDPYFPRPLVERGVAILVELCERIESEHPASLDALYVLSHEATEQFNELAEIFEQHESEIETVARDCIGMDFLHIARSYGFEADTETLIEPRTW